jgi:hypothetical protein
MVSIGATSGTSSSSSCLSQEVNEITAAVNKTKGRKLKNFLYNLEYFKS